MINLIPKEVEERARQRSLILGVSALYIVVLILITLSTFGLFAYNLTQQSILDTKKSQLAALEQEKQKNKEIVAKAAFIENRLKAISNFAENRKWEETLEAVAQAMPQDVRLTELKINSEKNQVILGLNGETLNRRSIILLKDKLNDSGLFTAARITTISEKADSQSQEKSFTFTINTLIAFNKKGSN